MLYFEKGVYRPEPAVPSELNRALRTTASEHLLLGRADWDLPHTRAVVYFAGEIARAEKADERALVTAAWFHDAGYRGLFNGDSRDYDEIQKRKAAHGVKSAELVQEFFKSGGVGRWYTSAQQDRIAHLVCVHDNLDQLKDPDEFMLMEADTLGMLHTDLITPTFNYENALKFVNELEQKRMVRFTTPKGLELLDGAYANFQNHLVRMQQ